MPEPAQTAADEPATLAPAAFICGCGHTGTWLLLAAMACHPLVDPVEEETHAFVPETDPDRVAALGARAAAAAARGQVMVEKTPKHVRAMDAIRESFPGARFLVALRDPFEVTASLMRRKWRFPAAFARMREDQALADAASGAPDAMVYRFEDLCTDPEGVLRRACETLGLPFDPAVLHHESGQGGRRVVEAIRAKAVGDRSAHRTLRADQVSRPIALPPARAGAELNARQIAKIERRMGAFIERHGYAAPRLEAEAAPDILT